MFLAGVAHPVERHLAKVEVASSSLVTRSIKQSLSLGKGCFFVRLLAGLSFPGKLLFEDFTHIPL